MLKQLEKVSFHTDISQTNTRLTYLTKPIRNGKIGRCWRQEAGHLPPGTNSWLDLILVTGDVDQMIVPTTLHCYVIIRTLTPIKSCEESGHHSPPHWIRYSPYCMLQISTWIEVPSTRHNEKVLQYRTQVPCEKSYFHKWVFGEKKAMVNTYRN